MHKNAKKTNAKNKRSYRKRKTATNKATTKDKTIRTIVKSEVAKNIENKISSTISTSSSIYTVLTAPDAGPTYEYFAWNFNTNNLFSIQQGTEQNQRVGNKIKIKRWIVKGTCYFDPLYTSNILIGENTTTYPPCAYVDIYLMRPLNTNDSFQLSLPAFYQNGNQVMNPQGQIIERTYAINKDAYKVYWHKRFKVGAQMNPTSGAFGMSNNDYKFNHEFGFDICKYVCKNKFIKYQDNNTQVEDSLIDSLTLVATCTYPNVDPNYNSITTEQTFYSPGKIQCSSYFEYEDA